MSGESVKEAAVNRFNCGFNCAEATLMSVAEALGVSMPGLTRVATAFGGGMSRHGEVCGALAGAGMALSLKYGRESGDDSDSKVSTYDRVGRLIEAFEEKFGSVRCIDLTGCDFRTPEGAERFARENMHADFCAKLVAFAAEEALRLEDG